MIVSCASLPSLHGYIGILQWLPTRPRTMQSHLCPSHPPYIVSQSVSRPYRSSPTCSHVHFQVDHYPDHAALDQWPSSYQGYYPPEFNLHLHYPPYDANDLVDEHAHNPHPESYLQSTSDCVPLHAPIPVALSTYSSLLPHEHSVAPALTQPVWGIYRPTPVPPGDAQELPAAPTIEPEPVNIYESSAPQVLFPTPSELLVNISSGDLALCESPSDMAASDTSSPASTKDAVLGDAEGSSPLNQRKAHFRAVSDAVGFAITDP